MTIEQLSARLEALHVEMEALLTSADDEADQVKSDEILAQFDAKKADAERIKANIERHRTLEAEKSAMPLKSGPNATDPKPQATVQAVSRPRYGKLKSFANTREGEEKAYRFGRWFQAAVWGDRRAAEFCREHGIMNVMTESTNSAGGFLVPDEFASTIIDLQEEYGVARQECNVWPMSSDHTTIPRRTGGLTVYAVGETDAATASDLAFDQVSLTAKEWVTLTRIAQALSEDAAVSVADRVAREIAIAFATKEDDCWINGDGTGATYHGIQGIHDKFGDGTSYAGGVNAASGVDTFAEVTATDLATAMAALPKYALTNAKFFCSQPAFSLVFERLAQAAGGLTKQAFGDATRPSYQGYPVVITQSMPTSTGDLSGQAMLLFGDMRSAVTLGVRREISIATSTERYFEFRQTGILGSERFDLNVHDIGDASTAGPVVALIGN